MDSQASSPLIQARVQARSIRIPFLVLTPVCIFLGFSTVINNQTEVDYYLLLMVMTAGLLAHISVNSLNEYFDFKSGLDFKTRKTSFSGGSGALPQNPEMATSVLSLGLLSLFATVAIGLYFVWLRGLEIIPLGMTGILLITTYTIWLTKKPLLCLISPGIGFGFAMVVGTYFVLTVEYSTLPWFASMIPFFLVNNLLLLNQYPDISADIEVGRRHFPIAYGTDMSNIIYALFVLATVATIITAIMLGHFPTLSLIALLPLPLAFYSLTGAIKHGEAIGEQPQYLGANVLVSVLTPLLLAISLVID